MQFRSTGESILEIDHHGAEYSLLRRMRMTLRRSMTERRKCQTEEYWLTTGFEIRTGQDLRYSRQPGNFCLFFCEIESRFMKHSAQGTAGTKS